MRKSYIIHGKAALLTLLLSLCMLGTVNAETAKGSIIYNGEKVEDGITYTYTVSSNNEITITKATIGDSYKKNNNNGVDVSFPSSINDIPVVSIDPQYSQNIFRNALMDFGNITIPEGIKEIGDSCFYLCGLKAITIPTTVTRLGSYCFSNTNFLEQIKFNDVENSKLTSIGEHCFSGIAITTLNDNKPFTLTIPMQNLTTVEGKVLSQKDYSNLKVLLVGKPQSTLTESDYDNLLNPVNRRKNGKYGTSNSKVVLNYPIEYANDYSTLTSSTIKGLKNPKAYAQYRYCKPTSKYGTICLRYTISASECANIKAFYEEKSENAVNDDHTYITFDQVTTLEAGKPYIFEQTGTTADDGTFTAADASGLVVFAIADADETPVTAEVNTGTYFKGTFEGKSYDDLKDGSNYILQGDGVFRKVGATSVKVGTYRAYLDLSSLLDGAKSNKIFINFKAGETTGIDGLTKDEGSVNNGWMYNVQGQRITAPAHGQLYIKNGKKYIKN